MGMMSLVTKKTTMTMMISSISIDAQDDRWATTIKVVPTTHNIKRFPFSLFRITSTPNTSSYHHHHLRFALFQEWMFFDVAKINAKGGDGGDGCMAMRREFRLEFGGPSGGNGGHGGSVYLECDSSLNTLSLLRRRVHHRGKDGTNGKGDSRHGQKGRDSVVYVPPGTIVR